MIYDVIIVGAGASGLFSAASFETTVNGLILNNSVTPGTKLLMSGSGQCNVTCSEDIKNFLRHYGDQGKKIRKPLFKFSNLALIDFLKNNGIQTFGREDGKIFPVSLRSKDVLDMLLNKSKANGFILKNDQCVVNILYEDNNYKVTTHDSAIYKCKNIIVATGGLSYPITGSDGSISNVLSALNINTIPCRPALVPIFVENYGFTSLSGISFPKATVSIQGNSYGGGLLFTHKSFSGPSVLNASRYASPGLDMIINYLPGINPIDFISNLKSIVSGNSRQISTVINDYLETLGESLPKRFIDLICQMILVNPVSKSSVITGKQLKSIVDKLTKDVHKISGTAGYSLAMCTSGGVSLEEIDLNTFQSKEYPHLYIVGEALDVDGDTGGYNLQFAFTSGYISAKHITSKL